MIEFTCAYELNGHDDPLKFEYHIGAPRSRNGTLREDPPWGLGSRGPRNEARHGQPADQVHTAGVDSPFRDPVLDGVPMDCSRVDAVGTTRMNARSETDK
ncbi:MAG TPA: hypothetical protein PKV98_12980 [Burkholderiaceae bacterium]|nr:hypothetical protein [Burkholderiaceae bacterium]